MDARMQKKWEFDGRMVEKGDKFLVEYMPAQRLTEEVLAFDGTRLMSEDCVPLEMDSFRIDKMTLIM